MMSRAYNVLPATEDLWAQFDYKPLTGELVRKKGAVVSNIPQASGYRKVNINGRSYPQHRVVWGWVSGADPGQNPMDHRDRNKTNNCFWNLRVCNDSINMLNREFKNYYYDKTHRSWIVKLVVAGKTKRKHCKSESEAEAVAREWKSPYIV